MNLSLKTTRCRADIQLPLVAFPTELELVDTFENLFNRCLKKGIHLEREFDCGFGIADAVIFKYKKIDSLLDLSIISPEWSYTLKRLPYRKNFDIEYLSSLSGASISSCKKAIKEFIQAGYCQEKNKNLYIKNREPKPLCNSIVAIEAKLRDWKKALWQASRYKTFANESWVLLDKKHSNPAISNIETFEKFNIGLATFSTDGSYDVHFSPRREMHKSDIAFWKANTLLAKSITRN